MQGKHSNFNTTARHLRTALEQVPRVAGVGGGGQSAGRRAGIRRHREPSAHLRSLQAPCALLARNRPTIRFFQ